MTVNAETSRITYVGDGVTSAFAVPFPFLADGDLYAYSESVAGDITPLTLSTHYTLVGAGDPAGGTLTMLTAPASGVKLTILRDPAITQQVDYAENDAFPAETHETALDRLTMIAQRSSDLIQRAIRLSDGDSTTGGSLLLPSRALRKNLLLSFDSNGDLSVSANVGTTVLSQSIIAALLYPNAIFLTGADPTGVTSSTAAIQSALNTGKDVIIPTGTYLAGNLTQSANFQRIIGIGHVVIVKNANGALLTCSGNYVIVDGIRWRGDAASPTFTGDGVVATGSYFRFLRSASYWMTGRAIKATGDAPHIAEPIDIIQTTDATGTGYDIELGLSGTNRLYGKVIGYNSGQATGGILMTDTGNMVVTGCQFGKLTIAAGTTPAGSNGGNISDNRILGNITIGLSNSTGTGNIISTITATWNGGTSGHSWDESNVYAAGATLVDNSTNSTIIDSRQIPLTSYTPAWTAASVNPTLGNGTLTGHYTKRGRECTVRLRLTVGSTTTFGTGIYYFSVPFIPSSTIAGTGTAWIIDSGTATFVGRVASLTDGTARIAVFTPGTPGGQISPTVPMTWANGDSLDLQITYPTAA